MPDIDPMIEEIILRAIDRSPRERYPRAQDMLDDLVDPSRVVPRDRSARANPPLLERIRLPRRVLVNGVLLVVVGSLLAHTWLSGRSGTRHRPPRSPSFDARSPAVDGPAESR